MQIGHVGTDWAQGGIPALLPYFIAACQLSYKGAAGIILPILSLSL
jgi:FSR family fosmidomycin resistance protein-like MFS transporter